MSDFHVTSTSVKIIPFQTTEKLAIEWASTWTWQTTASTEHNIRSILSRLQGPFKLIPFVYESEGAKMRGIKANLHESASFTPWRQPLVDSLVVYRRHFPQWGAAGGQALLINFHALSPNTFADEFVPEGRAARNFRFLVQRHLFGIAMNTSLESIIDNISISDWESRASSRS